MRDAPPQTAGWLTRALVCAIGTVGALAVTYVVVSVWHGSAHLNDFRAEAWPAYRALEHGHLGLFLKLSPAYAGSLVLRAPLLPLAALFGNGWRGAYLATALPCMIAGPALGVWLSAQPRANAGSGVTSRISPMVLCAANPVVIVCLGFGHPEDLLGATLCVAAVVLATRGSSGWAGLLIGLAVANKSWALVAVPVVLAVLPGDRRRALVAMVLSAGAILVPIFLARQSLAGATGAAASLGGQTTGIFLPPELLYWFGPHAWVVREAHILLVIVCAACAAGWWWLRARGRTRLPDPSEALLLLALVLFLRGALDPWDNLYYQTPFVFALMAYETRRTPRLTALFSLALLITVPPHLIPASPRAHAALYAAVAIPTILWLAAKLHLARRPGLLTPRPPQAASTRS